MIFPRWNQGNLSPAAVEVRTLFRRDVKQSRRDTIELLTSLLIEHVPEEQREGAFSGSAYLVPVPRSAKTDLEHVWPARDIAEHMVEQGAASRVRVAVERTETVPSSHQGSASERTSVRRHFETMKAHRAFSEAAPKIVLVDDVVTAGATMCGVALRLWEKYPRARISGYAVARTGDAAMIGSLREAVQPAREVVRLATWDSWPLRRPDDS